MFFREKIKRKFFSNILVRKLLWKIGVEWNIQEVRLKYILSIVALIFLILMSPAIYPPFAEKAASYMPFLDNEPPEIMSMSPAEDSHLLEASEIKVTFEELGGSGLDKVNSVIELNFTLVSSFIPYNSQINGSIAFPNEKTITFKPNVDLPPGTYTIKVQLKDNGGNNAKPITSRFYILENPSLFVKFDKMDEEHYSFIVGNSASFTAIEKVRIFVTLPSIIKKPIIKYGKGVKYYEFITGKSDITANKVVNESAKVDSCALYIEIKELETHGFLWGEIVTDSNTSNYENPYFCLKGGTGGTFRVYYDYNEYSEEHKNEIRGFVGGRPGVIVD